MLLQTPLVSIIIPCYNQAHFLNDALQSVFNQTYKNWECIIVNDGSKDHTEEIAKNWTEKDFRFQYCFKKNGGLSSARNMGLEKTQGQYIQFLDSDDILDSNKLRLSIAAFSKKDAKIVISNFKMFIKDIEKATVPFCDLSLELFTFENVLYNWEDGFSIPIHCGFFSADLFQEFRFPESIKSREDWIMWVFMFKDNPKIVYINQTLAFYRRNPASMTKTQDMLPDLIKAYTYLKSLLSKKEYEMLSIALITRYYRKASNFNKNMVELRNKGYVRIGYNMRKVLQKFNLHKPFKKFLP